MSPRDVGQYTAPLRHVNQQRQHHIEHGQTEETKMTIKDSGPGTSVILILSENSGEAQLPRRRLERSICSQRWCHIPEAETSGLGMPPRRISSSAGPFGRGRVQGGRGPAGDSKFEPGGVRRLEHGARRCLAQRHHIR